MKNALILILGLGLLFCSNAFAFETIFNSRVDYYEGVMLSYSIAVDLDHDSLPDLVDLQWEDYDSAYVFIRINMGNGTFGEPSSYSIGQGPREVVARDFDNDGNVDLAISDHVSNDIRVLFNDGTGHFPSHSTIYMSSPWEIRAFDFDNDGDQDIVVARHNDSYGVGYLQFFSNDHGSFQLTSTYSLSAYPMDIAVGDFNADSDTDVAVLCNTPNCLLILANHAGNFELRQNAFTTPQPVAIAAGDINNDGDIDLAIVDKNHDYNNSYIISMSNDGSGWFDPSGTVNFHGQPKSIMSRVGSKCTSWGRVKTGQFCCS